MVYRALLLSCLSSLALGAVAHADNVRIEGGPSSRAVKSQLKDALVKTGGAAQVCFKRKAPETIAVSVQVAPNGAVSSSKQDTDGPVAQCVAGIIAVTSMPATGKRYRLRALFDARKFSGGSVNDALKRFQSDLHACQKGKDGGRAKLEFVIHPDGRITDARVRGKNISDSEKKCLRKTIASARLGAGVTAKKVRYGLEVRFPKGGQAQSGGPATLPDGIRPQKDGPLAGGEIQKVMRRYIDKFNKCYAKELKKNRKLAGKVVLRFTIRDDGTVRNVKIKETGINNPKVEKCMVKVGKTLHFPGSSGSTRVFYPFVFTSK